MSIEHQISIDGRSIRYLEAGAGQPLLLIHAFPLNAGMWRPQLERVPSGWRFIAPDLRGFGGSDHVPDDEPTMDDYAADVFALMDALSIRHAAIAGLSLGGYVAFSMLRKAPLRLRAIVLADTRSQGDTPEGARARLSMLDRLRSHGVGSLADEMIPKLLGEISRDERPGLIPEVRHLIEGNPEPGVAAAITRLRTRPDSTPDLASINVPTLVLVGAQDGLTPVSNAEELHRGIKDSALVVLAGAGHLSNLEVPETFSSALNEFLRTVPV